MISRQLLVLPLLAVAAAGCLSGCGSSKSISISLTYVLTIRMNGGEATSNAGTATGGTASGMTIRSTGPITVGSVIPPLAPILPAYPAGGFSVPDGTTGETEAGDILVTGTVTTADQPSVLIESTGGDIVVTGSLISGNDGAGTHTNITLSAPMGTVHILGTVNSGGNGTADGDNAGTLTINAKGFVLTGILMARGEDDTTGLGGNGGTVAVTISGAGDIMIVGGLINASGGDGLNGGTGGNVSLYALDDVWILSSVHSQGGDADNTGGSASAGDGGDLDIQGPTSVTINALLNLRGGDAKATGSNTAWAGDAGDLAMNASSLGAPSGPVIYFGTTDLSGGDATGDAPLGFVDAGWGGSLDIGSGSTNAPSSVTTPQLDFDGWGGDGTTHGGDGGSFFINANNTGALSFVGNMDVSIGSGATAAGTPYPSFIFTIQGDLSLAGTITGRGGDSATAPSIGAVFGASSDDGNITSSLQIDLRGGSHTGGGPGAAGGQVAFESDEDWDGVGGDITFTGTIDVSGGTGAPGGDSPNSTTPGTAVLFDADGNDSNAATNGTVLNQGTIIARGGATNGNGGDILFDGLDASGTPGPDPGTIDVSGNGTGTAGSFTSQ